MDNQAVPKIITIRDAVIAVETQRKSTVISYIAASEALISPEDAGLIVDTIEMLLPPTGGKIQKLDLILHSPGGFIDAAYKLVRIFKEYSNEFNVIVPLAAKSAATVICLGAKEIVMTSFAELGPIDPIIQHPYKPEVRVPARSIKDFFEFINSTETSDKILIDDRFKVQMMNLFDPYLIGSYQTALKSSKQIAKILLSEGALKGKTDAEINKVVYSLTEEFYSHSFVIDRQAAKDMGLNITYAEDNKSLSMAIRQLFNSYSQFMSTNKIIKLVGNREINRNKAKPVQVAPQTQNTPAPVNLKF